MSKNVLLFALIFSIKSYAWIPIHLIYGNALMLAWIAENPAEVEAARRCNARAYPFLNEQYRLDTAYVFPSDARNQKSNNYHHQLYRQPGYSQPLQRPQLPQLPQPNLNRGLLTLPASQAHAVGALITLKFDTNAPRYPKYCRDFAYGRNGCWRDPCRFLHITKRDFIRRVVCFNQLSGVCRSNNCDHRHLLPHQLHQLQTIRARGGFVPIIFCDRNHTTSREQENCPFLHFSR